MISSHLFWSVSLLFILTTYWYFLRMPPSIKFMFLHFYKSYATIIFVRSWKNASFLLPQPNFLVTLSLLEFLWTLLKLKPSPTGRLPRTFKPSNHSLVLLTFTVVLFTISPPLFVL